MGEKREVGKLSEKPAVNKIEAESPIALPKDMSTAESIPGAMALRKILTAIWNLESPREREASFKEKGTF